MGEQIFIDDYKYLDPKIIRTKTPFSDQIVFGVGGGNYFEYQNLQDYVMSKNVGYSSIRVSQAALKPSGGWCMNNADQFLLGKTKWMMMWGFFFWTPRIVFIIICKQDWKVSISDV